ncbi:hypothetical protein HDU91_000823 [Kappamyces sp. JEL0680]|nr:hypothetical protein HDU91_000823 [Kappamyces sp. JEL0680]
MAPLTRYRSPNHQPQTELMKEYYAQRATPGGLIVTEATFISKEAGIIYMQLWAIGRANAGKEPGVEVVSASDLPFKGGAKPRALRVDEIQQYLRDYARAATLAVQAGFDGCEVHGAHGYLPDQFLQASSNNRTDAYGGSLENRARFMLEAVAAVASAIGQDRTAIRISPFSEFQGMGHERDPFATWGYVCSQLKQRHPQLAYVSITDPRLEGQAGGSVGNKVFSTDYFRGIIRYRAPG